MIELKNNGKINFIVNIHYEFRESLTGGILALHYLSYLLAEEGHNVYIFCKPQYPHENIHTIKSWRTKRMHGEGVHSEEAEERTWENFVYQQKNTVAIYDQDIIGNWFNCKNVARWVLYNGSQSIIDHWGENDEIFSYGQQENMLKGVKKKTKNLISMNMHLDIFKNNKNENRKGFCYLLHKHTSPNAGKFFEEINATNLSHWKKIPNHRNYLNEEFNKHEYFVCYDQLSFWPQIAALCGCKVIVMNAKDNPHSFYDYKLTPEQYRLENPLKKYGVAFGFNDLQHAINTQHLVEDHLNKMNEINLQTIKDFVKFWENKIRK